MRLIDGIGPVGRYGENQRNVIILKTKTFGLAIENSHSESAGRALGDEAIFWQSFKKYHHDIPLSFTGTISKAFL